MIDIIYGVAIVMIGCCMWWFYRLFEKLVDFEINHETQIHTLNLKLHDLRLDVAALERKGKS